MPSDREAGIQRCRPAPANGAPRLHNRRCILRSCLTKSHIATTPSPDHRAQRLRAHANERVHARTYLVAAPTTAGSLFFTIATGFAWKVLQRAYMNEEDMRFGAWFCFGVVLGTKIEKLCVMRSANIFGVAPRVSTVPGALVWM